VRPLALLPLAALAALAGCGSATVDELPPAARPARSPALHARPAGSVVDLAARPAGIAFTSASRTVAAGGRLTAVVAPRARVLELYDTRTHRRVARAPAGVGPTHVAAQGNHLYVTDTQGGALLVFALDGDHLEPTRRVYLPGSPYGIAVDPVRHRLWVTLTARNELVALPAHGRPHVVLRLPTVRQPDTVAVDSARGSVAVTGRADGVLQLVGPRQAYGEQQP
jgi:DNA-binding beta-propeller fold protein YncE